MYRAQDLVCGKNVAVKLEQWTQGPSLLEHEFQVLKKLDGGFGFPKPLWFGRESAYHALVLDSIATPLCDLITSHNGHLPVDVVLTVGHQLVSLIFNVLTVFY